jgi:RHS repeat-associated protein
MRYKPWGEVRHASGSGATKYQYTGQYSYASDFGLHFYNACWYDSSLSRFAQADTIIPEQSQGVQAWDRFAYVNNNPVRYNDPTGHCPVCGAAIGATVGALAGAVFYTAYNHKAFDVGEYRTAVLAGAAAGGLIGSGIGIIAAPQATAVAVQTAISVISAGTAATVTGGSYITQNPEGFETVPFLANTSISATTAYITSKPGMSGWNKFLARELAAEATYLLNAENPNAKDATTVFIGTLAGHGTSEFLGAALPPNQYSYFGQNVYPNNAVGNDLLRLAVSQRAQEGVIRGVLGLTNGIITGNVNNFARRNAKHIME